MAKKLRRRSSARFHALILGTYTVAIFLSALLLFGVQPMFTRMVLPQLGGSPSVWSVAMVFFQSMLLAGYAYAHVVASLHNRYAAVAIHLVLLLAAALTLPLAIAHGWGNPPVSAAAPMWLLGLFGLSIGLPFFALAANNPLLQAWFVRTGHDSAHDPYFLYAASNVGSFIALLSYPILFEPIFTLHAQNRLWSIGFVLLIVLIAVCGFLMLRVPARMASKTKKGRSGPKPGWPTIGRWIFIAAVPSGLLVAVTAYISTDIAAAPMLWALPLSLYLLTWVLVFQRQPLIPHRIALVLQPFAIAGIVALVVFAIRLGLFWNIAGHLLAFFFIALACHGELARTRPPARHLTTFYLALSFGGMVGGLFSGLVAPYVFSWVAEYPILAVLAVLCRPLNQHSSRSPLPLALGEVVNNWFWPVAIAIAIFLIYLSYDGFRFDDTDPHLTIIVLVLAVASLALLRDPPKSAFAVALAFATVWLFPVDGTNIQTLRSFFGIHKIYESDDGRFRILKNGSTIHGAERIETEDGEPVSGRPRPITYYHDKSAMNRVIEAVRARKGGPLRTAVIGLGSGSLACRIAPDETWRFFEIDPTIIAIARDPDRFTFLSSCAPGLPIVLGDARLTFAHESDHVYDLIIVDAYSSDAIPVHLATAEAMAIYKSKLSPQGVVMMHISNRHLELRSVVEGIAAANGLKTWIWSNGSEETDDENYVFGSDVAISAENENDIGALSHDKFWVLTPPNPDVRTWTDDYSNIAGAVWRKYYK
ncbi:MAG: fused MFS/spermidine synthase [Pseudolabrys sp.]